VCSRPPMTVGHSSPQGDGDRLAVIAQALTGGRQNWPGHAEAGPGNDLETRSALAGYLCQFLNRVPNRRDPTGTCGGASMPCDSNHRERRLKLAGS